VDESAADLLMRKSFASKSKSPVEVRKKTEVANTLAELTKQQLLQKKVDDLRELHKKNIMVNKEQPQKDNDLAEDF
jgi:aminoglycoside/choline kinase family phosphotransferase